MPTDRLCCVKLLQEFSIVYECILLVFLTRTDGGRKCNVKQNCHDEDILCDLTLNNIF